MSIAVPPPPPTAPKPPPPVEKQKPAPVPPPPPRKDVRPDDATRPQFSFAPSLQPDLGARRIGIYGEGGTGKTSLVATLQGIGYKPLLLDVDNGKREIEMPSLGQREGLCLWEDLRLAVSNHAAWAPYDVLVIDSLTRCQDWCFDYMLRCEGKETETVENIGGGYAKGYRKMFDLMLALLGDLEQHTRMGRHVITIFHSDEVMVPNPDGENYRAWLPNLYHSEKVSLRRKMKEWVDDLIFIGYDVLVAKGKGKGQGTRTLYMNERPAYWAKTRRDSQFDGPIAYTKGSTELWTRLLGDK